MLDSNALQNLPSYTRLENIHLAVVFSNSHQAVSSLIYTKPPNGHFTYLHQAVCTFFIFIDYYPDLYKGYSFKGCNSCNLVLKKIVLLLALFNGKARSKKYFVFRPNSNCMRIFLICECHNRMKTPEHSRTSHVPLMYSPFAMMVWHTHIHNKQMGLMWRYYVTLWHHDITLWRHLTSWCHSMTSYAITLWRHILSRCLSIWTRHLTMVPSYYVMKFYLMTLTFDLQTWTTIPA